jgi:hypothetical protein
MAIHGNRALHTIAAGLQFALIYSNFRTFLLLQLRFAGGAGAITPETRDQITPENIGETITQLIQKIEM